VKEQLGPAASLYAQADAALTSGQPERAEILLERALRIEPGNALYWHALGRAKYDQGDYAQAVQFCLKAQSRMGRRSDLARYNQELLDNASRQLAKSEQEKRKTQ
jgi:Tfp pilus assembly protein PilF